MTVVDAPVPGDPSGTAIGVVFPESGIESIVTGLKAVVEITPSLAEKAEEIRKELEDPNNPLASRKMRVVKIDRKVDMELLRKEGKLRATDCDKRKVFALTGALLIIGPEGVTLVGKVLSAFMKGGIPIKVDGVPGVDSSMFIRLYDEALEVKPVRVA